MTKNEKKARARDEAHSYENQIAELLERGGYTAEERVKACIETIDLSIARANIAARTGEATGSLAFAALAEKMQTVLANVETRQNNATDNKEQITVVFKGWDAPNDKDECN